SFTVPVLDDTIVEGPRNVYLILSNPTGGASIAGTNTVPLTILDNEIGIGFSSPVYSVSEGAGSVSVSVLRQNVSNGVFSAHVGTANRAATAGADYASTTGTPH